MKRITVDIDEKTHAAFKSKVAAQGLTATAVVNQLIADYLASKTPTAKRSTKGGKA